MTDKNEKRIAKMPEWFNPASEILNVADEKLQQKLFAELEAYDAITEAISITGHDSTLKGNEAFGFGTVIGLVVGGSALTIATGDLTLGVAAGFLSGFLTDSLISIALLTTSQKKTLNAINSGYAREGNKFRNSVWRQLPTSQRDSIKASKPGDE